MTRSPLPPALPAVLALAALLLAACAESPDPRAALMEADRAFSRLSVEKGTAEAFYQFIDDAGTALPRQGQPVTKEQYARFRREQASPRRSVLRWEPDTAEVAASGDLGWTRGHYELLRFDGGDTTRYTGHYITVWKRQKDGAWKFVLDAGNEDS